MGFGIILAIFWFVWFFGGFFWLKKKKIGEQIKKKCLVIGWTQLKLDGVGPVDNRPSTNKLHHFVKKKKFKKIKK